MIIKNLNNVTLNRVVSHHELEQIMNLETYIHTQTEYATQIVQKAQDELETNLAEHKQVLLSEMQAANAELISLSETKLNQFFTKLNQDLYTLIWHVLAKCGASNLDPLMLKDILAKELSNFSNLGVLKIKAHSNVLSQISSDLNKLGDKVLIESNDTLDEGFCICETNAWIMNLDIRTVQNKIKEFLSNPAPPQELEITTSEIEPLDLNPFKS